LGAVGADIDNDNKAMSLSDREEQRNQSMHYQSPEMTVAYFGALSFGEWTFAFLFGLRIGCFLFGVLGTSGKHSSNSLPSFSYLLELVAVVRLVLLIIGVVIG
jgi:hypothetical protein